MNTKLFSVITLRSLSLLLSLQGQAKAAAGMNKLIDAIEAGIEVDNHMAKVAEAMKAGTEAEWDDIVDRIETEVADFLGAPEVEFDPDADKDPPDGEGGEGEGEDAPPDDQSGGDPAVTG